MITTEIKAGSTYWGRNPEDIKHVYAIFFHEGVPFVVAGHPAIALWLANITELDRFAEHVQGEVSE